MLNLFLSVFFSSAAMTSVFLMYFIAEFLLRERFNHRTKAIALKIAIFLQPIFVLLAMLILLSGADFRENSGLKIFSEPIPRTDRPLMYSNPLRLRCPHCPREKVAR